MSRVIPIALAAQYAAGTAHLCQCLRLTRGDGFTIGLTSAPNNVVIPFDTFNSAGEDMQGLYLAWPGITPTDMSKSAGLAMANLEIRFGEEDDYINRAEVLQGMWNDTRFHLFQCDYRNPAAGVDEQMKGNLGNVDLDQLEYRAELLDLLNRLQQPIGHYTSKTCRVRFGSQGEGMCNVDIEDYTYDGALTAVDSARVLRDSAMDMPDGWFNDGLLTFNTGDLAGVPVKVKTYVVGVYTLELPLFSMPAPGDEYTIIAGCDKTRETCRDRFANILNMQAEPDLPGMDALSARP